MSGWTLARIDLSFLSQARNSSDKPLLVAEETEDEDTFLSLFAVILVSFFISISQSFALTWRHVLLTPALFITKALTRESEEAFFFLLCTIFQFVLF